VSYSAGRGRAERIIEFLDAESSIHEEAAESYAFLAMHYPGRRSLLKAVFEYSEGVHILRQPNVETAVGSLLSVQSSVALVGARLEAIARLFPANARVVEGRQLRLFPTVAQLKTLSTPAVESLRLGYRAPWFVELLARIPDEQGLEELRGIQSAERQRYFRNYVGIGPKVAACIDLFAYRGDDAFPVDTWVDRGVRRVLGLTSAQIRIARDHAAKELGPHCGLFGEYLFRYERDHGVSNRPPGSQRSAT
jgi:N-glycosylase/DNA lyase